MTIERLNYLLTGEEKPKFTTEREKTLIQECAKIITDLETARLTVEPIPGSSHKYQETEINLLHRELADGIKRCRKSQEMTSRSWGYETGVIISGHDAEYLLEVSKSVNSTK